MAWENHGVARRRREQETLSRPAGRRDDATVAHGLSQEDRASGRDAVGNVAARAAQALLNEQMNTRMETVDAYMQVIPPGSRSGKHRHLAEECLYVVEGYGYDLHQDCDVEITDTYEWKPQDEIKRYRMGGGRRYLYSALHHPSAFQRRSRAAGASHLLHQPYLQEFRPQRSRANRGCAGIRSQSRAHCRIDADLSRWRQKAGCVATPEAVWTYSGLLPRDSAAPDVFHLARPLIGAKRE